jgi:RNA polymerase sigma factor (sigma-70 family)
LKEYKIEALTDEELLIAFRDRKESSCLSELFGRHARFVFVVCMKYLRDEEQAKDMAMQVFEKVIEEVGRFEIRNFKSWLHVVAKNSCLMHLREVKKVQEIRFLDEKEMLIFVENHAGLHPEHSTSKEELLTDLEKAIDMLEDGQKQCVELFYLQEKSYKEVAEYTGFTMNQVKSYIQNGKRNLKNYMISNHHYLLIVFLSIYFDWH